MSSTVSSYSMSLVNALVSFGLLLLYMPSYRIWDWNPPFQAPKVIIFLYFLSNLFLVLVPFFPPASGKRIYEKLPYWVCYFWLQTLIDELFTLQTVTLSWRYSGVFDWYYVLVYMEHLASEKERIPSPTRMGYSKRWYPPICIPPITEVCIDIGTCACVQIPYYYKTSNPIATIYFLFFIAREDFKHGPLSPQE